MIFYCTNCWSEIDKDAVLCKNCGANQIELEQTDYSEKLIRALKHPEPETRIRAAEIIAGLNLKKALPIMLSILKNEKDPFISSALVKSILKLDSSQLDTVKKILGSQPSVILRKILR